jgi:phosphatidylinositol glycan class S
MASTKDADVALANPPPSLSSVKPLDVVRAQKLPPPESTESIWLRRFAILSFWVVVVFLGLPIWLKTTAIYRAELPLQGMTDWAEGKARIGSFPT